MANRYVIFTNDIHMIGGGQKYIANKLKYVSQYGWIPNVIYYDNPRNSQIYIWSLAPYKDNYIKETAVPPDFCTEKKIEVVLNKIKKLIEYCEEDQIVIESSTLVAAQWGELFAASVKGFHISFILNEHFSMNDRVRQFLYYKYKQGKLYGTGPQSLNLIFPDDVKYPIKDTTFFRACGGDSVDFQYSALPVDLGKYTKKISVFGRLDKHFVIPTMQEIKEYCSVRKEEKYLVIVIGGTDRKDELKPFEKMFSSVSNVDFCCTGPVFPVPYIWFSKMDVCIATAGAAGMAATLGCPTISICVQNDKPLGILGYTTASTRDMEKGTLFDKGIHDYLDMVLVDKYCEKHDLVYSKFSKYSYNHEAEQLEFNKQLSFALRPNEEYYKMELIKHSLLEKLKFKIMKIYWLRMLWHKVKIFLG